jgi:signal transduction histidine kinase
MLLTGILAKFILDMYNNIIGIAERESRKVKLTNLNLEMKVAARTRELEVQNDELKKLNIELDSFVYSVSHDLRAPLLSALGLINISKLETDETQRSYYLDLINKSLIKLDVFIQDIINLSRNARLEVQQEEIYFTQLIKSILEEHAFMENADKIEFITHISQSNPFCSDIKRLRIVLNNIVSNAIRYSNLYQQAPFVKIHVDVQPDKAIIEISDNGQGIAQEHIDKVFDMFYRASSKNVGSGLGLYIVRETIKKLNGTIKLTSEIEKRTSFLIEIPQAKL